MSKMRKLAKNAHASEEVLDGAEAEPVGDLLQNAARVDVHPGGLCGDVRDEEMKHRPEWDAVRLDGWRWAKRFGALRENAGFGKKNGQS
jgi:hypothetical protein